MLLYKIGLVLAYMISTGINGNAEIFNEDELTSDIISL